MGDTWKVYDQDDNLMAEVDEYNQGAISRTARDILGDILRRKINAVFYILNPDGSKVRIAVSRKEA